MQDLRLLIVIVKREFDENFTSFFREHGVESIFGLLCQGTAGQKLLSLLGLEKQARRCCIPWYSAKRPSA